MSFTFIDIISILGISQGIFLSISLSLIRDRNRYANQALALFIVFAVVMLTGRVLAFRFTGDLISKIAVTVDTTIFLFGPMIYLYVRRLVFQEKKKFKLHLGHFALAGIHLVYALFFWILPKDSLVQLYESGVTPLSGFVVETLGVLSFIAYNIWSFHLVGKHKEQMKEQLSYGLQVRSYVLWLLRIMALFSILWLVSFLCSYIFRVRVPGLNYTTMWVMVPVFIYMVGYFSLRQPEVFRVPFTPKSKKEKARLKPEEIKTLQKRLHYFVQEEKIYVQPDLTLKSLAVKINSSPNDLSWLLNQVYQQSFYEYVNTLRVKEVIKALDARAHQKHTLLAIAMDAGFNAKSTFNKAFKNFTGETPSQYIKRQQVA